MIVTSTIPTFMHVPSSSNQTFSLLLVDLSISTKTLKTDGFVQGVQLPLAPGIMANRTTRLHYWQPGVTFSANGTLVNMTEPIAFYQGPAPPPGDIAHTYVFYLFEQSAGFMPPPAGNPFSQALVNEGMNRMSFNVGNLAKETGIGSLIAANYIMVQNTMSSATATGAASATGTGSAITPSASSVTGAAGKLGVGMMEGLWTAVAIGFAMLS